MKRLCLIGLLGWGSVAGLLAQALSTSEVTVGLGYAEVDGDEDAYAARTRDEVGVLGGIVDFHTQVWEDDGTHFTIDGFGMPSREESQVKINFIDPEGLDYRVRFHTYTVASLDQSAALALALPAELPALADARVRRTQASLAALWEPFPEVQLTLELAWQSREGVKDSTRWGIISGLDRQTRGVLPTALEIDERRYDIALTLEKGDAYHRDGVRLAHTRRETDNTRRAATVLEGEEGSLETVTRTVDESDTFSLHSFHHHEVTENLRLTGSAAYVSLEGLMGGERVLVQRHDPLLQQQFVRLGLVERGFLDLDGQSDLRQFLLAGNALYQASSAWQLIPSVSLERTFRETMSAYTATELLRFRGDFVDALDAREAGSDEAFTEVEGRMEARRSFGDGAQLRLFAEGQFGRGRLTETLASQALFPRESDAVAALDYAARYRRTHWLAGARYFKTLRKGLTAHLEVTHRHQQQDYLTDRRESRNPVRTDYPGYLDEQQLALTEAGARLTWRPRNGIISVTQARYQYAERENAHEATAFTAWEQRAWVLSQQLTLQPHPRWWLHGQATWTHDTARTALADEPTDTPAYVAPARSGYLELSAHATYQASDRTTWEASVIVYQADHRPEEETVAVRFGYDLDEWQASLGFRQQWTETLASTLRVAYLDHASLSARDEDRFDALITSLHLTYVF